MEGIHATNTPKAALPQLAAQMGHLSISSTTAYTPPTHGTLGQHYQVVNSPHTTPFTTWTVANIQQQQQQETGGLDERNLTQVPYFPTGYMSASSHNQHLSMLVTTLQSYFPCP